MNEFQKRIEEVEAKAVESDLIARLATDGEVRTYNRRLAEELWDYAAKLRAECLNILEVGAFPEGDVHLRESIYERDEEDRQVCS